MHNRHFHSMLHHSIGRFQAQQAAAYDGGMLIIFCGVQHGVYIFNITECNHTFFIMAWNRDNKGFGTGRN